MSLQEAPQQVGNGRAATTKRPHVQVIGAGDDPRAAIHEEHIPPAMELNDARAQAGLIVLERSLLVYKRRHLSANDFRDIDEIAAILMRREPWISSADRSEP